MSENGGHPSLAALIVERRRALGLSQEELAERLGVGKAAVSKWESGRDNPSDQRIPELARTLGVRVNVIARLHRQNFEDYMRLAVGRIEGELAELRTAIHAVLLSNLAGDSQKLRELLEAAGQSQAPPPAQTTEPPSKQAARRRR